MPDAPPHPAALTPHLFLLFLCHLRLLVETFTERSYNECRIAPSASASLTVSVQESTGTLLYSRQL